MALTLHLRVLAEAMGIQINVFVEIHDFNLSCEYV